MAKDKYTLIAEELDPSKMSTVELVGESNRYRDLLSQSGDVSPAARKGVMACRRKLTVELMKRQDPDSDPTAYRDTVSHPQTDLTKEQKAAQVAATAKMKTDREAVKAKHQTVRDTRLSEAFDRALDEAHTLGYAGQAAKDFASKQTGYTPPPPPD